MRRLNVFAKPVQACVFPVSISDCLNVSLFHMQKIANPDPSSRVVIEKNTNIILDFFMVQVIICHNNCWLLIFHLTIKVPNCKICFPCVNKTSCQYMIEFIYIFFFVLLPFLFSVLIEIFRCDMFG